VSLNPTWKTGSWCDVAATSTGYAFVRVDGLAIICEVDGVEVWRRTASEPINFLRCACRTDTNEVRAIGYGGNTNTARYFSSASETSLGVIFGMRSAVLEYESGDWVAYICKTPYAYVRWPLSGAEPPPTRNPFAGGTTQGIRYIVATVPQWAEDTANQGHIAQTTLAGTVFQLPEVASTVTVGQAVGEPVTSEGILSYNGTGVSTIFPVQGFDPHVAALSGSRFAICARTQAVGGNSAALYIAPPWPTYSATATMGLPGIQAALKHPVVDVKTGYRITEPWAAVFRALTQQLATPIDLGSASVTGTPVSSGSATAADYVVGTLQPSLPAARIPIDTPTVRWDIGTANQIKAHAVSSQGIPGLDGEDGDSLAIVPGPTGPQGPPGSTGPQGTAGTGMPGLDGEDGDQWGLPGPMGPTGPTGATGPQGTQGTGAPGLDGEDADVWQLPGPMGPQGPAGTSGALVLLETQTASASASLDFAASISASYDTYLIEFLNLVPATDNVSFWMRVSTDGGATYDTSNLYSVMRFGWTNAASGPSGTAIGSPTSRMEVVAGADTIDSSTLYGVCGSMRLFSPLNTSVYTMTTGQLVLFSNAGNMPGLNVAGVYKSTTAVNAFQFLMSSGNIASGTIRVYGLTT
jgi:hypothetical protein